MKSKYLLLVMLALLSTAPLDAHRPVRFRSVDNRTFKAWIAKRNTVVVDVRTPAEYASGHIPGAINIDYNGRFFEKQLRDLNPRYNYAIYCRSGNRSKNAAARMSQLGLNVVELRDGIIRWNGPITSGPPHIHPPIHRPNPPHHPHNNGHKESDRRDNNNSGFRNNERR